MKAFADVLIALCALEHLWFLALEMFLWRKPVGLKTFRMDPEYAARTATLAANQGLYNGFLAAGLIWGLLATDEAFAFSVKSFFLVCVVIAGAYGGATVNRRIVFLQGLPAFIAGILLWVSR